MGRSRTPWGRYEAEYRDAKGRTRKMVGAWEGYGPATAEKAGEWALAFARSTMPDGVNAKIGAAEGIIVFPHRVRIIRQRDGLVVAEWMAPAFQVV